MLNITVDYLLKNSKMIFHFLSIGFLTSIFYFALFGLFYSGMHLDSRIAVSIAYLFSVSFYFLCNRFWTFRATEQSMKMQLPKYMALLLVNYLITLLIMQLVVAVFGWSAFFALVLAIGSTTGISFVACKHWIFR